MEDKELHAISALREIQKEMSVERLCMIFGTYVPLFWKQWNDKLQVSVF